MPTVQPLSAPERSQSFFAGSPFLAAASKLPIVIDVLCGSSASADCLYALSQALFPEALIIHCAAAQAPADIVFYDANAISRAHAEALELYRSHGAVLVPIAEFAEDVPHGLRHAAPLLLHPPVTRESLIEIIEPLRNHLALKWLQRGMEEVFFQHDALPHYAHTRRKQFESCTLTFPTALGEQEWEAASVLSFEAHGDETLLQDDATTARATNVVFVRLGEVADYLATTPAREHFVRVHKSTIVHLRHIHSAAPVNGSTSGKDLVLHLVCGRTCVCSRTYKNAFHEAMTRFAEQEGGSWKKHGGLWKRD